MSSELSTELVASLTQAVLTVLAELHPKEVPELAWMVAGSALSAPPEQRTVEALIDRTRAALDRYVEELRRRAIAGGASADDAARLANLSFRRRAVERAYELSPPVGPLDREALASAVALVAALEREGGGDAT